jgi:FkbM family methyltransferase
MVTIVDSKSLFVSLLKSLRCDLVLDIGSRDGKQSLLFKDVLSTAKVVAFEANPLNFQKMSLDPALQARIEALPWAVSDTDGKASFHIADADYNAAETIENNLGISSLLVHPGVKSSRSVEVETVRLDTLLRRPEFTVYQTIALWIDAESAEYFILEGMRNVADRVQLIQVETAKTPMRIGQRTYSEVSQLLASFGFTEIGSNITPQDNWGDVVFIKKALLRHVRRAQFKALVTRKLQVGRIAVFLKERSPFLYRLLRQVFVKGI